PQTSEGYTNGNTATDAKFNHPLGLALDSTGNNLFVADRDNNAIRRLDLAANQTFTFAEFINKPVGVAIDRADNVYVLNRGSGPDGSILQFDIYGDLVATIASGLINAAGIALDSIGNIYVTVNGNTLVRITQNGVTTVATIPDPNTSLQGLIVKHDGNIAICDAGRHGVYLVDPNTGIFSTIAGFHGAGDFTTANNVASSPTARFNQPTGVTEAGDGTLVVTDTGNHRVKVVLTNGVVRNLYGVSSNYWVQGSASQGIFPGWWDGTVVVPDVLGDVEARQPSGIVFAPDGKVYVTEVYYHLIRQATTGLPLPPPFAPKDLRATATEGKVNLFWSASTGATSYNVKRSQSSGGPYTTIASTTTTNYTDANVLEGTTYYYVVSALSASGESPNSQEVSVTTPFPPVPNPQIGYVEFPPPGFTSVFHPVSLAGVTFNNDKPIVIVGASGSQTFYTYSNTLNAASVPDPTASSASAPVGYQDGLFRSQVNSLTVASTLPNLTIKAIGEQSGRSNSAIVSAQFQFIVGNPNIIGDNAAQFTISDITQGADLWYTTDGSEPTNAFPSKLAGTSSGTNAITLSLSFPSGSPNVTFKVRGFKANYQPSEVVSQNFSASNFDANKITFGFASGEASSDFVASPGQFFYAPITLTVLPETKMYSLQFNLTVTNAGPNPGPAVTPGAFRFESFLEKPDPANPAFFLRIPPEMFTHYTTNFASVTTNGSTFLVTNLTPNFTSLAFSNNNLLGVGWLERAGKTNLYDTTVQDLIKYSQPHDTFFNEDNGKVVLGGYAFRVPGSAQISNTYQIQIGRPSATSDGVGAPGSDVYIATPTNGSLTVGDFNAIKNVTVGQRKYIAGDSAPFRWFNAGDFGNTNLNNSDVEQVFQSAVYLLNYPPLDSDFFDSMDSCGATYVNNGKGYLEFGSTSINTAAFFNGDDT
ncbi:MAG: hypothetical protein DME26_14500, partial [Verrucomicrobia bacterium]